MVSAPYFSFYQKNYGTEKEMQKRTRLRSHHANMFGGILLYNSKVQDVTANPVTM
jgi:hypothetical protein